jgi:hypothetical protein
MQARTLIAAVLVVLPAVATAQRGGSRAAAGRDPGLMDNSQQARGGVVNNGQIEDLSPVKLIIDKRKDLQLKDEQVKQVKDIESKMKKTNEPLFHVLDSLRNEAKPRLSGQSNVGADSRLRGSRSGGDAAGGGGGGMSDEDRAKMRGAMQEAASVIKDIRTNFDAAAKEALGLLDQEQQQKANDLISKQNEEWAKVLGGGGRS